MLPLALWSLPFLWIALSMTLRRAIDPEQWLWLTQLVFLLVPLPGGRTRLEGSTWYALDLAPRL